jgi:ribonuclease J
VRTLVETKILAGQRSIGGNFVRIEDHDRILILDQGMRFDIMNRYFSSFITPKGLPELRDLAILPKPEWYEAASSIYISHLHLDHLGALANIPSEIEACLPSLPIYEDMSKKWSMSPTWLALVPRKYYVKLRELKPLETDKNDIMPIPVSHSAYPAFSFLYFGKDQTVLYTGDFRIESYLNEEEFNELNSGENLISYLHNNTDTKIDTLVIEGTNFGSDKLPIAPEDAIGITRKLVSSHKQVIATLHGLDLEYAYALIKLALNLNLRVYVASPQIAKLFEKISQLPIRPKLIESYVDYLAEMEKVTIESIPEKALILVSYREVLDFIKDLRVSRTLSDNAVAIFSEPEPQVEESSDYGIFANWMVKMGMQSYRIRASGHYYPYQLRKILNTIRPKKIQVIHTDRPELFCSMAEKMIGAKLRSRVRDNR